MLKCIRCPHSTYYLCPIIIPVEPNPPVRDSSSSRAPWTVVLWIATARFDRRQSFDDEGWRALESCRANERR